MQASTTVPYLEFSSRLNESAREVICAGLLEPAAAVELREQDWEAIVRWARSALMLELLGAWSTSGGVSVRGNTPPTLTSEIRSRRARCNHLLAELGGVALALTDAGIDHRVFKGAGTITELYGGSIRDFSDADLVVPAEDYARARDVVERLGWRSSYAFSRPDLAASVATSQNFARGGRSIDLHRSTARQPLDQRIGAAPFRDGTTVGGRWMSLTAAGLVVCASLDLVWGGREPKPWAIRDCLQGLHLVDHAEIRRTAQEWNVLPAVAVGLDAAANLVGVPALLPDWVEAVDISAQDERLIRWFKEGPSWLFHLAVAKEMTGTRRKIDYLRAFTPTVAQLRRSRARDLVRRELLPRPFRRGGG